MAHQIERRIVVLYGDYDRQEQLERAYAHTARAIYILGEAKEDQDTTNLSCLAHIRHLHKKDSAIQDCFLLLTQPHLLRGAQLSNDQPAKEGIRLHVIHRHESWAQRVLVNCDSIGGVHYHPNIAPFEDLTKETQEIDTILVSNLIKQMPHN